MWNYVVGKSPKEMVNNIDVKYQCRYKLYGYESIVIIVINCVYILVVQTTYNMHF